MLKKILFLTIFLEIAFLLVCFRWIYENNQPYAVPYVEIGKGEYRNYPNFALTPGHIFPNITKAEVCYSGYAKLARKVPLSLKKEIYKSYGMEYPQLEGAYELDHFVSLCLGGSNSNINLWPQPTPEFRMKDKIEWILCRQVCEGKMTLKEAQKAIYSWKHLYNTLTENLGSEDIFKGYEESEEGNP